MSSNPPYLEEALHKQPGVVSEGGGGSTEAGAPLLGGGEEEAEGPHNLMRNRRFPSELEGCTTTSSEIQPL